MAEFTVTENSVEIEDAGSVTVYGVELKDENGERTGYCDISSDRAAAERFAELCRKNSVSSLSFFEVLEDYAAEL